MVSSSEWHLSHIGLCFKPTVNRCLLHVKWPVIVPTRTLRRDLFILKNLLPAALVKGSFKKNLEWLHLAFRRLNRLTWIFLQFSVYYYMFSVIFTILKCHQWNIQFNGFFIYHTFYLEGLKFVDFDSPYYPSQVASSPQLFDAFSSNPKTNQ
jgi:hypothetical protein